MTADDYKGIIIKESLKDGSILKKIRILDTTIENVTEGHQTPWLKIWTLYTVEVPEADAEKVAESLRKSLETEHTEWYADFKNSRRHFIIFSKKIFKVQKSKKAQYQDVLKYGVSLGMPEHQLDFSPQIK